MREKAIQFIFFDTRGRLSGSKMFLFERKPKTSRLASKVNLVVFDRTRKFDNFRKSSRNDYLATKPFVPEMTGLFSGEWHIWDDYILVG